MGVDVIESKTRTARKPHRCDYCGEIIGKGETYDYQKNIFDGTFYEWHTHLACSRVASAIWDYCDPDEGMSDQDLRMDAKKSARDSYALIALSGIRNTAIVMMI